MSAIKTTTIPADVLAALVETPPYAVKTLAEWQGPTIFNPIIGNWSGATFDNLAKSLALLQELYEKRDQIEATPGIDLLIGSCYAAAQYEAFRLKESAERPEAEGAAIAFDLLKEVRRTGESENSDSTDEDIANNIQRLTIATLQAIGGLEGAALDGFASVLAEYLHDLHTAGEPNLDRWRPAALRC